MGNDARPTPRAVPILFTSGAKGGTGKSTVVANLALLYEEPVAIVDAGLGQGSLVLRIHGIHDTSLGGFYDYLLGIREPIMVKSKYAHNIYLVPPGKVSENPFSLCRLLRSVELEEVARRLDELASLVAKFRIRHLLIDAPSPPTNELILLLISYSRIINLVIEPSESSIRSIEWVYEVINELGNDHMVNVVLNKYVNKLDKEKRLQAALVKYVSNGKVVTIPESAAVRFFTLHEVPVPEQRETREFYDGLRDLLGLLKFQVNALLGIVGRE